MKAFLLELGVEEMPSAYLGLLTDALRESLGRLFESRRLRVEQLTVGGTPRRLAAFGQVAERQDSARRRVKGPPVDRARDPSGAWTAAAEGFARRLGLPTDALELGEGAESGYLVATVVEPADPAEVLLPAMFGEAMADLNPPRSMRWASDDRRFVRPVRWLVAMIEDAVLDVSAFGLQAGRSTYGNRTDFPEAFFVSHAKDYPAGLLAHHVELHHEARVRRVEEQGAALADAGGGHLARHPGLLDEVADLVEWPVPFRGAFDEAALELPAEILETAMVHHQRYFPVLGEDGALQNAFIGVRNGEGIDLSGVVRGNEKVLWARLSDARFFYEEDRKTPLADRVAALDRVVFHRRLGTLGDKVRRMEGIARDLAPRLGLGEAETCHLVRAVQLCKTDLLSHVVGEFPELQGTMGGVYAAIQGEDRAVAAAISGQYHPSGHEDSLPAGRVAEALALVDRLDTLSGMEAEGLRPTGSEDPFGFRRLALGLARLLMEGTLASVGVDELVRPALRRFARTDATSVDHLVEFLRARVRGFYQGRARADLVDAALYGEEPWSTLAERVGELERRIREGNFEAMATTFKRVKNLAADTAPDLLDHYPDPGEEDLRQALLAARAGDAGYWDRVAALHAPVARFFESVLVMDPDPGVRSRRLGLLASVGQFLSRGADLARITGERGTS